MSENVDFVTFFEKSGMGAGKAQETSRNANLSKTLKRVIEEARAVDENFMEEKSVITLLYTLATKVKNQIVHHIPLLAAYIAKRKFTSEPQLTEAFNYLLHNPNPKVDIQKFEKTCGVGVVVTDEQIEDAVVGVVAKHKEAILGQRYAFNTGPLMAEVRSQLKWADGKKVRVAVEVEILDLLGPKTDADLKMKTNAPSDKAKEASKKQVPTAKAPAKKAVAAPSAQTDQPQPVAAVEAVSFTTEGYLDANGKLTPFIELAGHALHFHKPGQNYMSDGYVRTAKTMHLLKKHLEQTGGKVITRFPPEPNGILHIGHAKAINFNFGYARAHNGICYLRYDDTNPEKEEEKFFVGIRDMVEWLGYKPHEITHSSDYFQELYDLAVKLIHRDLAYVCHQTSEEIKGFNPPPSPWRDRPREESLRLFEDMRKGKINEGEATLRMKITLEEGKQDPVAYRIKFTPHHRTGDKWCIYPTYDYTHCLCDSIENITHSLCTKEFQSRRSSYYWLCNALDLYCPVQWEYGRLNLHYTVVSKRKIAKLISEKIVRDWDDPRLFTLTALRRRGFPPEAINMFCGKVGVSMAQVTLDPAMLDTCVRDVLNVMAPRAMAVIEPLKVTISNLPEDFPSSLRVPDFPADEAKSQHEVPFSRVLYIERSDFRETADKNYKRLAMDQLVGLRHANLAISVQEVIRDEETGAVKELLAQCHQMTEVSKPKAFIHWVSDPLVCEVRLYDRLFKHKNPEDKNEVPDGFISDCNESSLKVIKNAMVDRSVSGAKVGDKFQFERAGYFCVDPDSTKEKFVFNRTLPLKEDPSKTA